MKTKTSLRKNVHPSLSLIIVWCRTVEIFASFSTFAVKFLDFQFFTVHPYYLSASTFVSSPIPDDIPNTTILKINLFIIAFLLL